MPSSRPSRTRNWCPRSFRPCHLKDASVVLGTGKEPLTVAAGPLVVAERSVVGSITGTPFESERALDFSVLVGALPWFETMPLAQAQEAYGRMKRGDVKFRMVLTMDQTSRLLDSQDTDPDPHSNSSAP